MLIDYARVSSNEQDTGPQVAALKAAKCERIYRDALVRRVDGLREVEKWLHFLMIDAIIHGKNC